MRGYIGIDPECLDGEPYAVHKSISDAVEHCPDAIEINLSAHPDIRAIHGLLAQLEIALDRHNMGRTPYTIIAKIRRKIT